MTLELELNRRMLLVSPTFRSNVFVADLERRTRRMRILVVSDDCGGFLLSASGIPGVPPVGVGLCSFASEFGCVAEMLRTGTVSGTLELLLLLTRTGCALTFAVRALDGSTETLEPLALGRIIVGEALVGFIPRSGDTATVMALGIRRTLSRSTPSSATVSLSVCNATVTSS